MDQMPDGPRHHVTASPKKALSSLRGAEDAGEVSGDGGLLGEDDDAHGLDARAVGRSPPDHRRRPAAMAASAEGSMALAARGETSPSLEERCPGRAAGLAARPATSVAPSGNQRPLEASAQHSRKARPFGSRPRPLLRCSGSLGTLPLTHPSASAAVLRELWSDASGTLKLLSILVALDRARGVGSRRYGKSPWTQRRPRLTW